jgi:hypothetical protein
MSKTTLPKDKIIIDTADNPELAEYFSRKQPGDKCSGEFKNASLDEFSDGVAILSLNEDSEINLKAPTAEKKKGKKSGNYEESESGSAAVAMMKDKMEAESEPEETP